MLQTPRVGHDLADEQQRAESEASIRIVKGVSKARRNSDCDNGKNQRRLRSVSSMSDRVQFVPGLEELICGGVILAHESKSH